ncbi:TIGR03986 family CRISPR-associated RAMP protein [Halosquirtibacter laminarini]|uniref:TIGR03986 family CRISPR-associated RAMP protein n=1 Tax=Halosquirtibacter laminarini TaxID=3374600 RepID=A0AC61NQA2_9BACT|nr:TIGR03986 family CRISPR-associated RAMP protein [Prolixibacteraceae bacterium]
MSEIEMKAPYNFVPLSKNIYFPDWADQISHDVPFSDGESGVIDIKLTAESDIIVSDGNKNGTEQFCHYMHGGERQYFIPGTSMKGAIRSVFEILSFSKMDLIQDSKLALRDLNNTDVYTLTEDASKIRCGWLYQDGVDYKIEDCGRPLRISHADIDAFWSVNFVDSFKFNGAQTTQKGFPAKTIREEAKHAKFKYQMFTGKNLTYRYKEEHIKSKIEDKLMARFYSNSNQEGTLVFTGQIDARGEISKGKGKKRTVGKFYEFIFPSSTSHEIEVPYEKWDVFRKSYNDHLPDQISIDWKYWKEKLKEGGKVPVFFRNKGNIVKDFGLSFLYKLPYNYSVKDAREENHKRKIKDLASCVFGFTTDEDALKGRVQFGKLNTTSHVTTGSKVSVILGGPNASYYPTYIDQNHHSNGDGTIAKDSYETLMSPSARLAGWKRYPVKDSVKLGSKGNGNEKVKTHFIPLKEGVVFKGKIRVHNLRPVELGALISSLLLHGHPDALHHIGKAKSLGYGNVKLEITGMNGFSRSEVSYWMQKFEEELNVVLFSGKNQWCKESSIRELIAMSLPVVDRDDQLSYMELKDFSKAKGSKLGKNQTPGKYLERFTTVFGSDFVVPSYSDQSSLEMVMLNRKPQYDQYLDKQNAIEEKEKRAHEAILFEIKREKARQVEEEVKRKNEEKLHALEEKQAKERKQREAEQYEKDAYLESLRQQEEKKKREQAQEDKKRQEENKSKKESAALELIKSGLASSVLLDKGIKENKNSIRNYKNSLVLTNSCFSDSDLEVLKNLVGYSLKKTPKQWKNNKKGDFKWLIEIVGNASLVLSWVNS